MRAGTLRLGAAGVALALTLAGCTDGQASSWKPPTTSPSPGSGVAPGQFTPGSDGIGDSYYPKDGNGGYDVASYALEIEFNPASDRLTGHEVITAKATQGLSQFNLELHGLDVSAVKVDNAAATVSRKGDEMTVVPAQGIAKDSEFTVELDYAGVPEPYDEGGLGDVGFLTTPDGAIVQGEPDAAASWYAVNDHPKDKATYTISITVPSTVSAISNGVLQGKTVNGGKTTWKWAVTAPMASYLATVAIGRYRVRERTHNGMPFITAVHESLPTSIDNTMARTAEVTDFLVTQFGPYPFDAIGGVVHNAQVGFALENQTRPVYSPGFFIGGGDGTWVVVHEMAHQWFGDSVSVADWKDIWLNEGFATYAEWLWNEHVGIRTAEQTFREIYDGAGERLWPTPTGDPGADDLFSSSVYDRGGMTLHALRKTVGDADFFTIIKSWASEKRNGNATTPEFIALCERVSGDQLDALFDDWLYDRDKPASPPR